MISIFIAFQQKLNIYFPPIHAAASFLDFSTFDIYKLSKMIFFEVCTRLQVRNLFVDYFTFFLIYQLYKGSQCHNILKINDFMTKKYIRFSSIFMHQSQLATVICTLSYFYRFLQKISKRKNPLQIIRYFIFAVIFKSNISFKEPEIYPSLIQMKTCNNRQKRRLPKTIKMASNSSKLSICFSKLLDQYIFSLKQLQVFIIYKFLLQNRMKGLKNYQSQMHRKLIIDQQRRSNYNVHTASSKESQKQQLNLISAKDKNDSVLSLKINPVNLPKKEMRTQSKHYSIPKQEQLKVLQTRNIRPYQPQNQYKIKINNKSLSKRRLFSQQAPHKAKPFAEKCSLKQAKNLTEFINELCNHLSQTFVLQIKSGVVTIKKDNLIDLLNSLLLSTCKSQLYFGNKNSLYYLKPTYQNIKKYLDQETMNVKRLRLSIASNKISVKKVPLECQLDLNDVKSDIQKALKQKSKIDNQLQSLKNYFQCYTQQLRLKQQQLKEQQTKISKAKEQYCTEDKKLAGLLIQIQKQQNILRQNKQKVQTITNFVEKQEEKKILHWVSQAYKKIETQIYDYASYLQSNAMASSLSWQPKPFRAVQEWIYQQMQRVNKFVMSKAQDTEQKSKKMKQFIMNSIRKFKNKDEQMMKITDFKTQSIKKFIGMMQKWMENWQLKQEYLVSLRQEFVVQSQQIDKLIKNLYETSHTENNTGQTMLILLNDLKKNWEKVVLNYSYGNSFY